MEAAIGYRPALPAREPEHSVRAASPGICAVLDVLDVLDRHGPCTLAQLARATPLSPLTAGFHGVARGLVARHNETTCLTVLDGRDSVFIAKEETTHAVRLVTAVGSRLPAFAAASGRAMLADRPEEEVAALYGGCELETPTGRRLDGVEELFEILREARRRGYAENIDETALGLHCLAAPVGPPGRVVAALTLCVPSGRMSPARRREMLPDLLRAARDIVPPGRDNDGRGGGDPIPDGPGNGETAPAAPNELNQSNKLTTLGASIPRHRGRRRPDPNRKVAP